ncbi:DinB family protein [Halobacillus litoralis]|uniref:DinB family protein n=1 Tax=Halobacillus litoralis TaxID=45668 RepID=UPI001CD33BB7|nr:DinB family protein [Halobacillus litoralis]MCA0969230.1 DinB family protein [Halobacillus litoralis]
MKIEKIEGFEPQIGLLVSQMEYVRRTTLEAVQGLTVSELDALHKPDGNTIGALLLHIAAVEKGFQIEFFDGRKPNAEETKEWGPAYSLGASAREVIQGNPLDYYVHKLDEVRNRTLEVFSQKSDRWLFEDCLWDQQPSNHYFIWFHVYEDEINHRGQIRIIRKMLGEG